MDVRNQSTYSWFPQAGGRMERRTQSTRISNANQWAGTATLAGALLRFQCLDREEANRKAALHPSQSRSAWTSGAGTVAVEQFSLVLLRRSRTSPDQRHGHSDDDSSPASRVTGRFR